MIVHYGAPPPQPVTADTGPLYDVQLLSFSSFSAADPTYAKCSVLNADVPMMTGTLPKGTLSCGCPGVSCSSGSSCSFSLEGVGKCLEEGYDYAAAALAWASEAYEDLKEAAIDAALKYSGIGEVCAAIGTASECKQALTTAVEYGLASMGVPPSIPDFDKLMTEGQDYLIETAIQEVKDQGYPCGSECEAAIKAGYGELAKSASGAGRRGRRRGADCFSASACQRGAGNDAHAGDTPHRYRGHPC